MIRRSVPSGKGWSIFGRAACVAVACALMTGCALGKKGTQASAAPHRKTISTAQLNTILQHAYPTAKQWATLSGGNSAMQWQGLLSPTSRVVVTIDLYSGKVLSQEGPQSVSGAVAVVKGFYAALADGNPEAAWIMLNPIVYNPNPEFYYPQTYNAFMSENKIPGSPVKNITSVQWSFPGPGWKYLGCECYLFGGDQHSPGGFVRVQGALANGQQVDTEVIRGGNGTWSRVRPTNVEQNVKRLLITRTSHG